ncbi:MAG: ParA family protein, partial [Nocardioides sp.]|nr:ParA family protein [Nocardioides sp.]
MRTASEVADLGPTSGGTFGDEATPLARAAEHMLLARQGARLRPS